MKIISWNVNGIRAIVKKNFEDFLQDYKPDVLCIQETKISQQKIEDEKFNFINYKCFWHSALRPGYSGVAVLIKKTLIKKYNISEKNIIVGIKKDKFDIEGRTLTIDFGKFYLINNYFPNANRELSRLDYKIEYNNEFLKFVKKLNQKKAVIVTGDFNVAHEEIDLARPKDNVGNPGFTKEERNWMTKFLKSGFIDTYRYKNGNKIQYSWWSFRSAARQRNVGWRIDYFCISQSFVKNIKKAFIFDKIVGSDHCPVGIEL